MDKYSQAEVEAGVAEAEKMLAAEKAMNKYIKVFNTLWYSRSSLMDWLGMETMLVDILKDADLTDAQKVKLSKECIDIYTRRGHFPELWKAGERV